jgi:YggT family protein
LLAFHRSALTHARDALDERAALSHYSRVTNVITAFDALLGVLRVAFFALAVLLALVTLIDWMVRSRRLNPFSPVARFFRQNIDPVFAPVERRVIQAGGLPSSAPWWALGAAVLGGIIVLSALGFIRSMMVRATFAAERGASGILGLVIFWLFELLSIALIVRVISSWIRVSPYSKWVRWSFVLTEPILRPLRAVIPPFGMIDVTPIVAFFLLRIVESFVLAQV